MIVIVDYGLGNLFSVQGALTHLGHESVISSESQVINKADKLILPGVGAFGLGMEKLREKKIIEVLSENVVVKKKPILGICLGFQLLCQDSEEFGQHDGLGWLDAHVKKIPAVDGLRVPHVGWDSCKFDPSHPLFKGIPGDALFYFVHSYHVSMKTNQSLIASTTYGVEFASAAGKENIFGTQFHPEKSQQWGLKLLNNFVEI